MQCPFPFGTRAKCLSCLPVFPNFVIFSVAPVLLKKGNENLFRKANFLSLRRTSTRPCVILKDVSTNINLSAWKEQESCVLLFLLKTSFPSAGLDGLVAGRPDPRSE